MRYGLKPIAVDSKTHMLTLPCVSALTHIVFQVQHHPHSCLINSTATRTKFMFTLNLPKMIHDQDVFSSREDRNSYMFHLHQRDTGLGVGRFELVQLDLCCDRDLYQFTGQQSRNISIQNKNEQHIQQFCWMYQTPHKRLSEQSE